MFIYCNCILHNINLFVPSDFLFNFYNFCCDQDFFHFICPKYRIMLKKEQFLLDCLSKS